MELKQNIVPKVTEVGPVIQTMFLANRPNGYQTKSKYSEKTRVFDPLNTLSDPLDSKPHRPVLQNVKTDPHFFIFGPFSKIITPKRLFRRSKWNFGVIL
jgi:hypothetical protein